LNQESPDKHTLEPRNYLPGIRAFSERYVFLASEGSRKSEIMPAQQEIALTPNVKNELVEQEW
jgi:hypothetical protein